MSSTTTTITTPQVLPRDARLIALLLAANGAEDCEEGVVRMLVEFAHRKSVSSFLYKKKTIINKIYSNLLF